VWLQVSGRYSGHRIAVLNWPESHLFQRARGRSYTWLCTRESQKIARIPLSSTVWCTMSSYRLGMVLLVDYTHTFCRGCAMHFGGRGATSGREVKWFLRHDNAPSQTSLVVSSPNRRTLRISLRVTSGCSGLKGAPRRPSNLMRRPSCGRLQKKPSAGASNSGRINEASVWVCVCGCVCVCEHARACSVLKVKRCRLFYHYRAAAEFREPFDCPSCILVAVWSFPLTPSHVLVSSLAALLVPVLTDW
jgi:hypothetical protein